MRQFHVKPAVLAQPLPLGRRIGAILVALGGILLDQTAAGISTTSVNFIQGSLALTPDEGSWILTAFNAAYYTSILMSAWTVTHFGRKRVLVTALLGFALFSILSAFAWSFSSLIVFRTLQGMTLGCVFVPALLTIFVAVPPADISKAFLPFSFVSLAGSTVGYFFGGVFVEYAQWQDVFAVISGLAIIIAIGVVVFVPTDTSTKHRPLDLVGVAIALVAATSFQYLVNEGERRNWFDDPNVTLALIVFTIAAIAFALWKLGFSRHPFVQLQLLGRTPFFLGSTSALLLSLSQFSGIAFVQFAQSPAVQLSPTWAGGLYALRIVSFALAISIVGIFVILRKVNVRVVLTIALLGFAALTLLQTNVMTATADFDAFVPFALLIGLAQGAANQPLPLLVFGSLSRAEVPVGAIIYKMAPLIGTSIATAFSQRFLDVRTAQHLSDLAGGVNLASPDIADFVRSGGAHTLTALVNEQASVLAYDDVTRVFAVAAILIIPILYLIPMPKPNGAPT